MANEDIDSHSEIYGKLEHQIALSHLINPESLGNLLARFGEFLDLGLVAIDPDGAVIASGGRRLRPCALGGADVAQCPACAADLPLFQGEEKFTSVTCRSRLRFLRVRIDNQFDPIGHLVMGPFAVSPSPGTANTADAALKLDATLERVPTMTEERAHETALLMCAILEEVVFSNYQSYLFSKMHLQLNRDDPNAAPGGGAGGSGAGPPVLDSGEFSSLF